jgi:hypothetical protein
MTPAAVCLNAVPLLLSRLPDDAAEIHAGGPFACFLAGRPKDMLLMPSFWQSADMCLCIARVPIMLKVCTSLRESRSRPRAASFVKTAAP